MERLAVFLRQENLIVNEVPVPMPMRQVDMPWAHPLWPTAAPEDIAAAVGGAVTEAGSVLLHRWASSEAPAGDVDPLAHAGAWTDEEISLRKLQRQVQLRFLYEQELLELQRHHHERFPSGPDTSLLTTQLNPFSSRPFLSSFSGPSRSAGTAPTSATSTPLLLSPLPSRVSSPGAPVSTQPEASRTPPLLVANESIAPHRPSIRRKRRRELPADSSAHVSPTNVPVPAFFWTMATDAAQSAGAFAPTQDCGTQLGPGSRPSPAFESRRLEAVRTYGSLRRTAGALLRVPKPDRSTPSLPHCQYLGNDHDRPICGLPVLPLSQFCVRHILHDPRQCLYTVCRANDCDEPVLRFQHRQYCMVHERLSLSQ